MKICGQCGAEYTDDWVTPCVNGAVIDGRLDSCGGRVERLDDVVEAASRAARADLAASITQNVSPHVDRIRHLLEAAGAKGCVLTLTPTEAWHLSLLLSFATRAPMLSPMTPVIAGTGTAVLALLKTYIGRVLLDAPVPPPPPTEPPPQEGTP